MATNIKTIGSGSNRINNNLTIINSRATDVNNQFIGKLDKYNKNSVWASSLSALGDITTSAGGIVAASGHPIGGAITSAAGVLISGTSSIWNSLNNRKILRAEALQSRISTYFDDMSNMIANYGTALEDRDDILYAARTNLDSIYNQMNTTYGEQFTSAIQNIFYSKNDIFSNVNSIYLNNYKTFNEDNGGSIAGWNQGEFYGESELTTDINNYFTGNYTELEAKDLNNGITNSLYQMLVGADTSFAMQMRGSEQELKNAISNALLAQRTNYLDYAEQLKGLGINATQNSINQALELSEASARRAFSGLRNGTSTSNEALVKLGNDIADYTESISRANFIGKVQNAIQMQQVNLSQQIQAQRNQQQYALKSATEQALSNWNANVRSTNEAERNANKALSSANEYISAAERDNDKLIALTSNINYV